MFQLNLETLANACKTNPKLITICKGNSQILCKVLLEQSGYNKDLHKWKGRYCFIVKYLIEITLKAKGKVSLKQKDKLLKTINERHLDIPKTIIRFIEKNDDSIQTGKGYDGKSIFDKYIEELDTLMDEHQKKKKLQKIDDLLKELNDHHVLEVKIEELNKALVSADSRTKHSILKQRNLLQKRLNEIISTYSSLTNDSFNPFKAGISPVSQESPASTVSSDTSDTSDTSNIFKTKKSGSIVSTDSQDDKESYFSDDKQLSYTLREISEKLPDILKSYFTSARLQGKYKLPENVVTSALSNYRSKDNNELTIFEGNFIEIDTIYGNGKILGKIIDTDNIVNVTDMYRYGTFPITVFLHRLNKNE